MNVSKVSKPIAAVSAAAVEKNKSTERTACAVSLSSLKKKRSSLDDSDESNRKKHKAEIFINPKTIIETTAIPSNIRLQQTQKTGAEEQHNLAASNIKVEYGSLEDICQDRCRKAMEGCREDKIIVCNFKTNTDCGISSTKNEEEYVTCANNADQEINIGNTIANIPKKDVSSIISIEKSEMSDTNANPEELDFVLFHSSAEIKPATIEASTFNSNSGNATTVTPKAPPFAHSRLNNLSTNATNVCGQTQTALLNRVNIPSSLKGPHLMVNTKKLSEVAQTTAKVSIGNTTISVPLLKPLTKAQLIQGGHIIGEKPMQIHTSNASTIVSSSTQQQHLNISKLLNVKCGTKNQPTIVSLSGLQIKPAATKIVATKVVAKKLPQNQSSGIVTITSANHNPSTFTMIETDLNVQNSSEQIAKVGRITANKITYNENIQKILLNKSKSVDISISTTSVPNANSLLASEEHNNNNNSSNNLVLKSIDTSKATINCSSTINIIKQPLQQTQTPLTAVSNSSIMMTPPLSSELSPTTSTMSVSSIINESISKPAICINNTVSNLSNRSLLSIPKNISLLVPKNPVTSKSKTSALTTSAAVGENADKTIQQNKITNKTSQNTLNTVSMNTHDSAVTAVPITVHSAPMSSVTAIATTSQIKKSQSKTNDACESGQKIKHEKDHIECHKLRKHDYKNPTISELTIRQSDPKMHCSDNETSENKNAGKRMYCNPSQITSTSIPTTLTLSTHTSTAKMDESHNVLLKQLLQNSNSTHNLNQISITSSHVPTSGSTICGSQVLPVRKVINVRAPSLGYVSSLEQQLSRPVLPPVPATATTSASSAPTAVVVQTITANTLHTLTQQHQNLSQLTSMKAHSDIQVAKLEKNRELYSKRSTQINDASASGTTLTPHTQLDLKIKPVISKETSFISAPTRIKTSKIDIPAKNDILFSQTQFDIKPIVLTESMPIGTPSSNISISISKPKDMHSKTNTMDCECNSLIESKKEFLKYNNVAEISSNSFTPVLNNNVDKIQQQHTVKKQNWQVVKDNTLNNQNLNHGNTTHIQKQMPVGALINTNVHQMYQNLSKPLIPSMYVEYKQKDEEKSNLSSVSDNISNTSMQQTTKEKKTEPVLVQNAKQNVRDSQQNSIGTINISSSADCNQKISSEPINDMTPTVTDQRRKRKREYQKPRRSNINTHKDSLTSQQISPSAVSNGGLPIASTVSIASTTTSMNNTVGFNSSMSKKRIQRKFPKIEEDYDSFIEKLMMNIRQMQPLQVLEPHLNRNFLFCSMNSDNSKPSPLSLQLYFNKISELDCEDIEKIYGPYGNVKHPAMKGLYDECNSGTVTCNNNKSIPTIQNDFYDQEFTSHIQQNSYEKAFNQLTKFRDVNIGSYDIIEQDINENANNESIVLTLEGQIAWNTNQRMTAYPGLVLTNNDKFCFGRMSPIINIVDSSQSYNFHVTPMVSNNAIDSSVHIENNYSDDCRTKNFQINKNSNPKKNQNVIISLNSPGDNIACILRDLANLLHISPALTCKIIDAEKSFAATEAVDIQQAKFYSDFTNIINGACKVCHNCGTALVSPGIKVKNNFLSSLISSDETKGLIPFISKSVPFKIMPYHYYCSRECLKHKQTTESTNSLHSTSNASFATNVNNTQLQANTKMGARKLPDLLQNESEQEVIKGAIKHNSCVKIFSKNCFTKKDNDMSIGSSTNMKTDCLPNNTIWKYNGPIIEDTRQCVFCSQIGDGQSNGPSRLLNFDVDKWVHLNCALWSNGVYETISGGLMNFQAALQAGLNQPCNSCHQLGATLKCFKSRCSSFFHLPCAIKDECVFYKNKTIHCQQHAVLCDKENELNSLVVHRRVFVERDENRQIASVMHYSELSNLLRVGNLIFLNVGQLLPHQLEAFHTPNYIYPIGYKVSRYYWCMKRPNKRCRYICTIAEVSSRPEFRIHFQDPNGSGDLEFRDKTPTGAWQQILEPITQLRRQHKWLQLFPQHISGEDLFGLTEPLIVRILESLPGIETLTDYRFKYGRNPLLEFPLAINPSGAARTEPKQRHLLVWRKPHTQRTAGTPLQRIPNTTAVAGEVACPYSKQFVHSKSSQYKKMKQEWRNNVFLARSKIQGLGLYAARDIEKHTMIIEYIGEVIRTEVSEIREKQYEAKNRGIYMFRLNEDRVVDATLSGGLARYINHSCNPNCVTEIVEVDRDVRIIIFAKRKIYRGEELSYDYKFDIEDDAHKIPCACSAPNCRKWMN